MATTLRRRKSLGFRDRISRLTWHQACRLLGDQGAELLRSGSRRFEVDVEQDIYLAGDLFRVRVADPDADGGMAVVVLTQVTAKSKELHLRCDRCEAPCEHAGAAIMLLLEEKLALGLAAPPDDAVPLELLTPQELVERALAERRERAASEKMTLRTMDSSTPWTDYVVTSHASGKSYRVALRGTQAGESYCSCPDFRSNRLGTCKHILHALQKVNQRFPKKQLNKPYRRSNVSLRVDYRDPVGLRFNVPHQTDAVVDEQASPFADQTLTDATDAVHRIRNLERSGHDVHIYPDAEEWIERR